MYMLPKVDNVLDYVPYLTEEDFARAESIDDRALAESFPDNVDGGPIKSNGTMEVVGVRVRLTSFGYCTVNSDSAVVSSES